VIAEGRTRGMRQIALYLWLAAITAACRGELCVVQVCDIDLEHGILHIAFNYMVKNGQKIREDLSSATVTSARLVDRPT
jgi:integrase